MIEWLQIHEHLLWWLFAFSLIMFIATLVIVPWLIVRLPADYFAYERRHQPVRGHLLVRTALAILKNIVGSLLLLLGIIMLITPGQGALTILVGLMLLNYPGKYRVERWIVSRPLLLTAINWLRQRAGRQPLEL